MKNTGFKASSFRIILVFILALNVFIIVGGFYLSYQKLNDYASKVYSIAPTAFSDNEQDTITKKLKEEADNNRSISDKANNVILVEQNYQGQVIIDLNKYASLSGIPLPTYNFNATESTTSSIPSIQGINIKSFIITINEPIEYSSLIKFLKYIETNRPVIQITGINISRDSNNKVLVNPINARVYTK
ncbi:MAG TPA: hypothetical protein PLO25_01590 [Candidatus Saccharibacteria bacterium]|nr:hypothetical protein [Candidatus Saccharibacteria bacterium]